MKRIWEILQCCTDLKIEIASSAPKKKAIGSEIIKWYQGTEYSHILIIINDMIFQATHARVNIVPFLDFEKDHKIINRIEVQKEKCDFKFLFDSLGKKYGFAQILKIAIKFIILSKLRLVKSFKYKDNKSQTLICSEYAGKFLKLPWVNDLTDPKEIITYLLSIKRE